MSDRVEPLPSATVAVVRDGRQGLEVLLLERVGKKGKPGPSVFPGGKVEDIDRVAAAENDLERVARQAAVRETHEESGLSLDASGLVRISRWITPAIRSKRFDTWFYLAAVSAESEVQVDGSEIGSHRWLTPAAAVEAQHSGDLSLAPPTFVTVSWLTEFEKSDDALHKLGSAELITFRPQIHRLEDCVCILYPGDAGYEAGDVERAGQRHRLWARGGTWEYERKGV